MAGKGRVPLIQARSAVTDDARGDSAARAAHRQAAIQEPALQMFGVARPRTHTLGERLGYAESRETGFVEGAAPGSGPDTEPPTTPDTGTPWAGGAAGTATP